MEKEIDKKWLEEDIKLHAEAGLDYVGLNEDNKPEYIGTDKNWKKFNQIAYE